MNDIRVFDSEDFGEVRTVMIDNVPYFVGKDVAEILGYSNTRDALARHVDDEDKITVVISDGNKGNPNQTAINESGLYSLILSSQLQSAKKFKRWVTSEVLPALRKNGFYEIPISDQIQILAKGNMELSNRVDGLENDLNKFKKDMPLLAVECEKITKAVNHKGVEAMGGRNSEAYQNKHIRGKVYADIHNEVRRQFGVNTYKAIKRSECDKAISVINNYELPLALKNEVDNANLQTRIDI